MVLILCTLHSTTLANDDLILQNKNLQLKVKLLNEKLLEAEKKIFELDNLRIEVARKHDEQLSFIINQYNEKIKLLEKSLPATPSPSNPPIKKDLSSNGQTSSNWQNRKSESNPSPSIDEKLDSINIPGIQFLGSPLTEVIEEIQRVSKNSDKSESNPSRKGVNIYVKANDSAPLPKITVSLSSMILRDLLDFLVEMIGWTYVVRDNVIVLEPGPSAIKPDVLATEFFEITPKTLARMVLLPQVQDDELNLSNPEDLTRLISKIFGQSGIVFNPSEGSSLHYDQSTGELRVTHRTQALDSIRDILGRISRANTF